MVNRKINKKVNSLIVARIKKGQKIRRKSVSPYASIDWKNATQLFQRDSQKKIVQKTITARSLLLWLAGAADKGLVYLAHADDPAVVEYLLEGTGPLSWRMQHMVSRFQQQKYVTLEEKPDGSIVMRITKHGFVRALGYNLSTMQLKKPNMWDKKWRLVIFDVPEKHRRLRDIFRLRLKQLGLYALQESVYISPYSCFDEVEFLRELYGIAFTVRYLLVEKVEDDEYLRTHFKLT